MKKLILVIIITVIIGLLLFRPLRTNEGLAVEGLTSDEAIKNIASIYNTDKMAVTNLNVTENTNTKTLNVSDKTNTKILNVGDQLFVAGATSEPGNKWAINLPVGGTISSQGRMHIGGPELLYLLNKSGVIIGKEWGGNGNLSVKGDISGPTIDNIYSRFTNQYYPGMWLSGWDVPGRADFQTSGLDDCINQCRANPESQACSLRIDDNKCWCKKLKSLGSAQHNHDMVIFGDRPRTKVW